MQLSRRRSRVAASAAAVLTLTACGSGFDEEAGGPTQTPGADLTVLIGASGDAEKKFVEDAVAAWSAESGTKATVLVASDMAQQLSQGFTSGRPADLFYLSNDTMPAYAANGSLEPIPDTFARLADFQEPIKASFTYEGELYAVPKDFSTLALLINEKAWAAAGLTDADVPTTWEQLAATARELTTAKQTGLTMGPEFARAGVFLAQSGGWLTSPDGAVTADSAENIRGLDFVKSLLADETLRYSSDLGAGWGGEAFGKELAAMTIEGNWIVGAMKNDYPDVDYRAVELPAGPGGKGTMQFNGGWGIAAQSKNKEGAFALAEYLTHPDRQLAAADSFGVMPSVLSAAEPWKTRFPEQAAFLAGGEYARSIPPVVGITDVISDLNAQLEALPAADSRKVLGTVQTNLQAIVK